MSKLLVLELGVCVYVFVCVCDCVCLCLSICTMHASLVIGVFIAFLKDSAASASRQFQFLDSQDAARVEFGLGICLNMAQHRLSVASVSVWQEL